MDVGLRCRERISASAGYSCLLCSSVDQPDHSQLNIVTSGLSSHFAPIPRAYGTTVVRADEMLIMLHSTEWLIVYTQAVGARMSPKDLQCSTFHREQTSSSAIATWDNARAHSDFKGVGHFEAKF